MNNKGKMEFIAGSPDVVSTLQVETLFDYPEYDYKKDNDAYLLVSIKAPEVQVTKERPFLAISACLDNSGSMKGEKLDSLKKSMIKMIQHLSDKDILGIVSFSSAIRELFVPDRMTAENKEKAILEVNKLRDDASTNLSGGFLKSAEQLSKISAKDYLKRILMFTDGQANEGVTEPIALQNLIKEMLSNSTLSSFGYGSDYNETLLSAISTEGKGNSYYIKSPENIPEAFARELGGLLSLFGQNLKVKLSFQDCLTLKTCYFDFQHEIKGNSVSIDISDIYSEEVRNLLFKVNLKTQPTPQVDLLTAAAKVEYFDIVDKQEKKITCFTKVNLNKKTPESGINKKVGEQIVISEAAVAQKEAMRLGATGDFIGAKSILSGVSGVMGTYGSLGINTAVPMADLAIVESAYQNQAMYASSTNMLNSTRRSYSTGRGMSAGMNFTADTTAQVEMLKAFKEPDEEEIKKANKKKAK